MERARIWAVRCVHESKLYRENCFLTLTYSPEKLPPLGSLRPKDFTLFMKRLRKSIHPAKIRFFQCGEYGEKLLRPHHHCIIFGWWPPDAVMLKKTGKTTLYTSPLIEKLWGNGFITVGMVNYESAGYVARYVLKKVNGDHADSHYMGKIPEYTTMSRRPGIGNAWIKKYYNDVYKSDELVYGLGKITKAPRYYDKIFEKEFPEEFEKIRKERVKTAVNGEYNAPDRVRVREKLLRARLSNLDRKIHS